MTAIDESVWEAARVLAFEWLARHPKRRPEVWAELRRLLGYAGPGRIRGLTWADVHDLATTLIFDSPSFAARCRREVVRAADRACATEDKKRVFS